MPGTRDAADSAVLHNPDIVLAFDYGLRRIGIATGNLLTRTASGLATLETRNGEPPWSRLDAVVASFDPGTLVVGVPRSPRPEARPAPVAAGARRFAAALAARYGLPVASVDETLTSREAEAEVRAARRGGMATRRVQKDGRKGGGVDARAARLIAEQWMNEQPRRRTPP